MDQKRALRQMDFMRKKSSKMRLAAERWKSPWEILITTILAARSRDEKTIPVATELFKRYPNANKLANAKLSDVEKIIKQINFYRNKSKMIINCSKELVKKYKGKIPKKIEELIKLPGVGRKTANLLISELGGDAIAVDTHVSYISQKLGWTKNKKPEKIEEDLKKLFQKKYWSKINSTLVRFGKTYTSRKEKDKVLKDISKIE